jgi:hypothetical protein
MKVRKSWQLSPWILTFVAWRLEVEQFITVLGVKD